MYALSGFDFVYAISTCILKLNPIFQILHRSRLTTTPCTTLFYHVLSIHMKVFMTITHRETYFTSLKAWSKVSPKALDHPRCFAFSTHSNIMFKNRNKWHGEIEVASTFDIVDWYIWMFNLINCNHPCIGFWVVYQPLSRSLRHVLKSPFICSSNHHSNLTFLCL